MQSFFAFLLNFMLKCLLKIEHSALNLMYIFHQNNLRFRLSQNWATRAHSHSSLNVSAQISKNSNFRTSNQFIQTDCKQSSNYLESWSPKNDGIFWASNKWVMILMISILIKYVVFFVNVCGLMSYIPINFKSIFSWNSISWTLDWNLQWH